MAELRYNIAQVLNEAFGINKIAYPAIPIDAGPGVRPAYPGVEVQEVTPANLLSHLGTPVLFPIKFIGGSYRKYRNGEVVEVPLPDYRLPFTSVAEFSRGKISNETKASGGVGTVKEVYGFEDWAVTISGVFVDENPHIFPGDQIEGLLQYEEMVDSIRVEGEIFRLLNIFNLMIKHIRTPAVVGKPNYKPFQLTCLSDEPENFLIF